MPTIPFDVVAWLPACGKSITLSGSAADALTIRPPFDIYVVGVAARVTTAIVGTSTMPVISVDVADADASTNRAEAVALTFTDADDAGDLRVAMLEPVDYKIVDVSAGRVIVLEHKTQAVGSAAGVADCFVLLKLAGRSEFKDV